MQHRHRNKNKNPVFLRCYTPRSLIISAMYLIKAYDHYHYQYIYTLP